MVLVVNMTPIMSIDPSGDFSWKAFLTATVIVAAVALATVAVVATAGAALVAVGAVSSAVVGSAIGGAAVGAAVAGGVELLTQTALYGGDEYDMGALVTNTVIGGVSGAFGGGIAKAISSVGGSIIVSKAVNVTANVIVANTMYLTSCAISGSDMSLNGFVTTNVGAVMSGVGLYTPALKSTIMSVGIEIAGKIDQVISTIKEHISQVLPTS